MRPKTISEKILSAKSGQDAVAGDVVICDVDLVLGTDASTPMAIDYFNRMGGERVFDAQRIMFALDHYSGTPTPRTRSFHEAVRNFAEPRDIEVRSVGDGISFQIASESGRALPGSLVIGADSHTVTCGALNLFATGIGSSDLAAAMITGQIWLRVPATIRIVLTGRRRSSVTAKDVALTIVSRLGAEGANYQAVEFSGPGVASFALEERLVLSNLLVESGAKAAMFGADAELDAHLAAHGISSYAPVAADDDAVYSREVEVDLAALSPIVALPHSPARTTTLAGAAGTPIHMV